MTYLLIAAASDCCARRVADALRREADAEVCLVSEPFVAQSKFNWRLTSQTSSSSLLLGDSGLHICADALRGAFVRTYAGPPLEGDWPAAELEYVVGEAQAALLAWLSQLSCRVINRPTATEWFRPRRPYPELQVLMSRCGLPTLAAQLTNDFNAARDFARRHDGAVTYMPLTSRKRYCLQDDQQWTKLAKLMQTLPVCLIERAAEGCGSAWIIGREVVWDTEELELPMRCRFEQALRNFAACLGRDSFEIQMARGREGPCCIDMNPCPRLERYGEEAQERVVQSICAQLRRGP
jgi:hypothetical protein